MLPLLALLLFITSPPEPAFETHIRPLLMARCGHCHGADLQEAKLDLRTRSEIFRGGESGAAVVPGKPAESLLTDLTSRGQMPPLGEAPLTADEQSLLNRWIEAGAPGTEPLESLPPHSQITEQDRSHYAFRPPAAVSPPTVVRSDLVATPIDNFLLNRLEQSGLTFSEEADRLTLIRRLSLDLTGLPPEPAMVRAFLADARPDAWERVVEQLLSSPHYGERWARHWLDAAGYVDGKLDNDLGSLYPNTGIWRYRDYVVKSLNDDKPFNRFLTEQLAGDELVDWRSAEAYSPQTLELLIATGFLRNVDDHTDFPQYGVEKRYEVIQETLDMVSTAILGLTMECCRCHNHKYDPLPQRDYYRLFACFEPAFNVQAWKPPKERYLHDVPPARHLAIEAENKVLDEQLQQLDQSVSATRRSALLRVREQRLADVQEDLRAALVSALDTAPEKRSDEQKKLAADFPAVAVIAEADVDAALTDDERKSLATAAEQRSQLVGRKRTTNIIQALWEDGPLPQTRVFRRGNVHTPGIPVQPGFPEVLLPAASPAPAAAAVDVQGASSGRRLALAHWLTQPEHPLTARVFVNRVWHQHFGRGIVETLGNFGRSGSPPSHPELLDWLARDFIEHGWSIRQLHRRILLSRAWRQSSRRAPEGSAAVDQPESPSIAAEQIDPENRLLWRMNLRRLESEALRDAILCAAGTLDRSMGGPPIEITIPPDGLSEPKPLGPDTARQRRSLYLFARRVYPLKFLELFDAPIMAVNCTQRTQSATVLQSLALLNSGFMLEQSERLAGRLVADLPVADLPPLVESAWWLVLSRPPLPAESTEAVAFLQKQTGLYTTEQAEAAAGQRDNHSAATRALADLCQMLLSSNEFLYVE